MTSDLNSTDHPWLKDAGARRIMDVISDINGEARFVGGVVRDSLSGRGVGDIDLAVDLPPERVMAALSAVNIKVVPTGIAHGTITAVVGGKGYEITTLRRDVETDGRRATVEFTDDWKADAARRDFTMNALYVDAEGVLYDYFGGLDDLAKGRVRFIGDAAARIREDVLRILRFFRFLAWFPRGLPDDDGLVACRELAPLLPTLSVERVWREVKKLLLAPDPAPAWRLMAENRIISTILPDAVNVARLERLIAVESGFSAPNAIRRLAALTIGSSPIGEKLHLSKRDSETLTVLATLPAKLRGNTDPISLRRIIYAHGAAYVRDALLLLAAEDTGVDINAAMAVVEAWNSPVFPVRGEDVIKSGVPHGPRVGEILREVENWWQSEDFRPSRADCMKEVARIADGTHESF